MGRMTRPATERMEHMQNHDTVTWAARTEGGRPIAYYSLTKDGERVKLTETPAISDSRPVSVTANNGMSDHRGDSPTEARERLGETPGVAEALDRWFPEAVQ
jgi:hypothetical protein